MEAIFQPWPWWVSGILVGLTVPLLFILAGKAFGISTSLQQIGAMCVPHSKLTYFANYKRKEGVWVLLFALGIAAGGYIGNFWLSSTPIEFLPAAFYAWPGLLKLFIGGILIGFGTRYAGGCTSGHSITGIANLNWPSLVATIFFFVGGLAVSWGIGHLLFGPLN
ncbi:MAG TPA: YeeE/YedE thiosulfate transporter family protein [Pirellulaceae bacterium]|nr:YeeE/YedE thiosulfate transporter family protein [Pirellulaceae bacterium]HMO92819.1 YeeE/YedE thiosulfate transporter family protein [Pirellulaceae bacterium]HMP69438.1 YeeE/YedE thiosulfate transporter family protein [Pirellulaceae bacterium]